jgi:hypothetical protein
MLLAGSIMVDAPKALPLKWQLRQWESSLRATIWWGIRLRPGCNTALKVTSPDSGFVTAMPSF